ncbi:hypothetical protein [Streptomyces brasiliensis]|uniref:Uncharacterized protein n=1 Tax=Streptomyces brasiliensis TaxID=1954 RepID=A0A917L3L1_9ACTN|nr:hypothetical protein [Streptomyces brasiliensis]GGJ41319.1 hypothetical protein GCM10010121_060440 [Streptomyces brasiliensis]
MQVRVTAEGITILDPSLLTALSVVTELDVHATPRALVADGLARDTDEGATGHGHVWLDVAELGRRAQTPRDAEWRKRYDAMIAYAADKGWADDTRSVVRAHLEAPR